MNGWVIIALCLVIGIMIFWGVIMLLKEGYK